MPKGKRVSWSHAEIELIGRYFKSNWREMTLYRKILNVNSSRTYESMTRELRRWRTKGWRKDNEIAKSRLRIGYLDIEASDLQADFGYMISWCIKPRNKRDIIEGCITKKEIIDETLDRRITKELLKAFDHFDILYTHWGADRRFDLPFIRTRAYAHGIQNMLPRKGEKFIMDTWPIARNKLRLHNNRLDSIAQAVGIRGVKKTPLDASIWVPAGLGNPKALAYVLKHNRHDVRILEGIHKKLEPVEAQSLKGM